MVAASLADGYSPQLSIAVYCVAACCSLCVSASLWPLRTACIGCCILTGPGFMLILSTNFLVTYNYFRMQSADLEYARCLKLKSDRGAAGKDRMAAKAIQEGHLTAGDGNML